MQPVVPTNQHRDHGLDLLKWLAMLSMVLDHLRYVGWSLDFLYIPGRMAFPWFCLAIAANVARRPDTPLRLAYLGWLVMFSMLAEWPYRLFVGPDEPLNVLPTLALGLLVASAWQTRQPRALWLGAGALLAGALAWDQLMFGLPGVLLPTVFLVVLERRPGWSILPGLVCLFANEWYVIIPAARQYNWVAAGGVLACLIAPWLGMSLMRKCQGLKVPPMRRWAYLIYPVHFILLLGLRSVI